MGKMAIAVGAPLEARRAAPNRWEGVREGASIH